MTDHLQKLKCEDKEQNRSILNKSLLSFRLHKGNWPALEKAETLISTSAWIEYSAQCKNVYIRSTMLFGTSTRQLGRRNQRSNIPFPLFLLSNTDYGGKTVSQTKIRQKKKKHLIWAFSRLPPRFNCIFTSFFSQEKQKLSQSWEKALDKCLLLIYTHKNNTKNYTYKHVLTSNDTKL